MTDLRPLSPGVPMPDNVITDNSPASTATALQVLYAGCLDSDPYFCLKQCDRVVVSGLRERGVKVRGLQDELPQGKLFRKLNRKILYPALVGKMTRAQRSAIRNQPSSDLRPLTSSLPLVFHIGSQCYANLIPGVARRQRLAISDQRSVNLRPPTSDLRPLVSITVHDLAEHYFPQDLTPAQMRRWRKRIAHIKQADLVFSVSQHTKDDLIRLFGIPESKIIVNYNGVDSEFRGLEAEALEAARNSLGVTCQDSGFRGDGSGEKRFRVLCVGSNIYRKNIATLVKALEELVRRGVPVTLIKCGDPIPKHLTPNTQHLTPKTENLKTINLGHVSKAELIALYNLCDVLSFPSLYEGFGMPVIEAQRCGLPCVASNASCLPEIGGDGALYHDPLDVGGLSDQLQRVYEDEVLRNDLREKGFKNAQRFSWDTHVEILMQEFQRVLGEESVRC